MEKRTNFGLCAAIRSFPNPLLCSTATTFREISEEATMRVGIAGISHESNSFSSQPATLARFGMLRGQEIVARHKDSNSKVAGYLQGAAEYGFTAVPLFVAGATPMGPLTADTYGTLIDEVLGSIRDAGPLDGLFLYLHGAMVSEAYPDADGEMCACVRRLLGPDIPILTTPDIHANMSQQMVVNTTATVLYRMNPHLDTRERGLETASLMGRTLRGEIDPVQWLEMPPMAINILKQHTREEPSLGLVQDAQEAMERPKILSASFSLSYQYADVLEMGASFIAVADGDVQAARKAAQWMARRAWARREDFVADALSPGEALVQAAECAERPVVLMDVGDNVGGGSAADSTILLEQAMRLGIRELMVILKDPESVRACAQAGVGATVSLRVGGKTDDMHGQPVPIQGRVRALTDGRFVEDHPVHGGGRFFDQGLTAVVETDQEHTLLLTSLPMPPVSLEQVRSAGIKPERLKILVAKGVVAPRGAYQPIAARIVLVNTPGATCADMSQFDYRRRRRPLYPLEPDATY
jgi:microcystin degradation protein MlrC